LLFNQRKILGEEMMIRSRRKILQSTLALPVVLALPRVSWSQADEYPNREIHSICMFPAGTGADIIVRYYSRKLQDLAGKPVVVENRIGAAGNIATEYVARSKPDGYTLLPFAGTTVALTYHLYKNPPVEVGTALQVAATTNNSM